MWGSQRHGAFSAYELKWQLQSSTANWCRGSRSVRLLIICTLRLLPEMLHFQRKLNTSHSFRALNGDGWGLDLHYMKNNGQHSELPSCCWILSLCKRNSATLSTVHKLTTFTRNSYVCILKVFAHTLPCCFFAVLRSSKPFTEIVTVLESSNLSQAI